MKFVTFELKTEILNLQLRFTKPDQEGWLTVFVDVAAKPFTGSYAFSMLNSEICELIKYS